jgi:hypothetical protein
LARQVRSVLRKAFGNRHADLRLIAGPAGLRIQAQGFDHAVEYHDPAPREPAELLVPFDVLGDVQGSRKDPVVLTTPKKSVLAAAWGARGSPHTMQYRLPKGSYAPFPTASCALVDNPPALIRALRDAYETTDPDSSRFALGCIQLRGKTGEIAATDGRTSLSAKAIRAHSPFAAVAAPASPLAPPSTWPYPCASSSAPRCRA